jgi:hypothetical protein
VGIPEDPVEATGRLLEDVDRRPRRINLGRVDGRYFLMSCGVGFTPPSSTGWRGIST